jgi:hypothetical protein
MGKAWGRKCPNHALCTERENTEFNRRQSLSRNVDRIEPAV